MCGVVALLLNPILYGLLMFYASDISFLNRMSICFVTIIGLMSILTWRYPLAEPFKQVPKTDMDLRTSKIAAFFGIVVVVITIALYVYFWDHETAMFEGFGAWLKSLHP